MSSTFRIRFFISLFATLFLGLFVPKAAAQNIDDKGDELFKAHCFEKATQQYLKVYRKNPSNKSNPKLVRRITESILASEMKRDIAKEFADLTLLYYDDAEAYMMAARAHYHAHDFDVALAMLDSFQVRVTKESQIEQADRLNSWIRNARRMLKDTLKNHILNLGETVNTASNELHPYIINDDQTLVFSCDDKFDKENIINVYNIKTSDLTKVSWSNAKKVSGPVNTPGDEYPSGPTDRGFFFCSNRTGDFSIFESVYNGNGRVTEVYEFHDPIDLLGSEVAACLSPGGDTLFFSATDLKGKLDIYYSIRSMDGQWHEARPIPGLVNREGSDENYPYLTNNGTRLYFASDREGSMGGYDIFYSDFDFRRNEWGKPVQMPYPINDTYDNMTISFSQNGRYAYVSLLRDDSFGGRDIYAVLFDHVVPNSAIFRCTLKKRNEQKKVVALDSQPNIVITDEKGEQVAILRMNMRTQSFVIVLDPGTYTVTIDAPGAERYEEKLVIAEAVYAPVPIEKNIVLTNSSNRK